MEDSGHCLFSNAGVACACALSRDITDRFIASAQPACGFRGGLFHNGVLWPELFEQRSGESAQLLQSARGTGQSDQPSPRRPTFRFDRKNTCSTGDTRDFSSAEHRRRSWILAP